MFPAYRSRLHSLPPPEALRSMLPFVSERMRKRRCFADKELEAVMFERERQLQAEKMKNTASHMCHAMVIDPTRPHVPLGNVSAREFLQKIFPTHNPNVLELVWQGCGGDVEKTIEKIASNMPLQDAPQVGPSAQPMCSQRPEAGTATALTKSQPLPVCHLQTNPTFKAQMRHPNMATAPHCSQNAPHRFARLYEQCHPAFLGGFTLIQHASTAPLGAHQEDLLSQKSAFQATTSRKNESHPRVSEGSATSHQKSANSFLPSKSGHRFNESKAPIKFSVESIIGK